MSTDKQRKQKPRVNIVIERETNERLMQLREAWTTELQGAPTKPRVIAQAIELALAATAQAKKGAKK